MDRRPSSARTAAFAVLGPGGAAPHHLGVALRTTLPDAFRYQPGFAPEADLLARLTAEVRWEAHTFTLFGRSIPMPRRIAWQGPVAYRYSGVVHPPAPFTPTVAALRERVQAITGERYNTVLLNLYRDGNDSMGWHHDADYDPAGQPCIASISIGQARRFSIRARDGTARFHVELEGGSLLWMGPTAQRDWQHALPKTARTIGPRINLTFRHMAEP